MVSPADDSHRRCCLETSRTACLRSRIFIFRQTWVRAAMIRWLDYEVEAIGLHKVLNVLLLALAELMLYGCFD